MLVLSRKQDEFLVITAPDGMEIRIVVVRIGQDKVRLGISAPREVIIDRQQIHERKQRDKAKNVSKPIRQSDDELCQPNAANPEIKTG